MSYLDVPRIHFTGTFTANPSTVNNTPENFNPAVTNPDPAWNPMGNHYWTFLNCTVRSAVNTSGKVITSSSDDPVIGATVSSTDTPSTAKLVDLDPEQQMVSEIWGLQIKLALAGGGYFVGNFRVMPFDDLWFRLNDPSPDAGDSVFGAFYQSILDSVEWGGNINSKVLQSLENLSPAALSIKFNVDGYQMDSTQPDFTQGRVTGTIGPAWADEPANFVIGRLLRPRGYDPRKPFNGTPLNFAPARVDKVRRSLFIDLGNSVPTQSAGGPPVDLGQLNAAIFIPNKRPVVLGQVDYSQQAYETFAGVQEFSLSDTELAQIANNPIGIFRTTRALTPTPLLQENPSGAYVNATEFVYRMNPGDTASVDLIATIFGEPAPNQTITLKYNNSMLQPDPSIPVGRPTTALTFPKSVTTGDDGRAGFCLTAGDPGNPRKFIDGQVYGVGFTWSKDNDRTYPPDPHNFLSVLVHDRYDRAPTWESVQPVLQQYAKLYPFMDSIFQLDDPTVIKANITAFLMVLNIPMSDPRYMPVTRVMSRDKRQVIINWLNLGAPVVTS